MSGAEIIEVMMYDDFIRSKIIKHNDLVDNLKDGIKYLTDTNAESISFNIQKKLNLLILMYQKLIKIIIIFTHMIFTHIIIKNKQI